MNQQEKKDKHMSDKIFNELYDAYEKKGSAVKKERMFTKWQSLIKLCTF